MALNFNYRHASPRSLLGTGAASGKQVPASPGGALAKLKSFFGGTGPSRPKVVSGGHNKGDLLLRRTGPSRPLDLARLRQAPPGRAYVAVPTPTPAVGGQPGSTPGVNGVATPRPVPVQTPTSPAPTLDGRIEALREAVVAAKGAAGDITELRRAVAGERWDGRWAAKQAQLVDRQQTAAAAIDKALATVGGLLKAHAADPEAVRALEPLRAMLVEQGIAVQLSGVIEAAGRPLPTDVLPQLKALAATLEPDDTVLVGTMAVDLGEAMRLAERGGSPEAMRGLARKVDALLANLATCKVAGGGSADETAEGAKAVDALRRLATVVRTKVGLADAVEHLAKASGETPPLPVGAALRAMASGLPSLRDWGNSPLPVHNRNAAESLATLAEIVAGGEVPDTLLGHDPAFDGAALALKVRWAENRAEQHLNQQHTMLALPPPTAEETAAARADGRLAATQRHELTIANRRLEGLLKTDRRVWHQPSTWGEKGLVFGQGAAAGVRKDAQFMAALRNLGGKDAGRDVALLMARISDLELKTLVAEKQVLSLHPKLDLAALAPRANDPRGPLAHLGVDRADLKGMGLTATDVAELERQVVALAGQGLRNADEVQATTKAINDAVDRVMRSALAQNAFDDQAGHSTQATARRLATDILRDVAGAHDGPAPKPNDPAVVDGFQRQMVAAERMILEDGGTKAMSGLFAGAEAYRAAEHAMAAQLQAHKDVDTRLEACTKVLADARDRLGMDVDPHKPKGLESAKALLRALDAHNALRADPTDLEAKARLDRSLDELKGFDAGSMRRPWHGKLSAFFGRAERPSVSDLAQYRLAAEAIVYIREGAAQDKAIIRGQIEAQGAVMDDLLTARREAQPEATATARRAIRAAVLANWTASNREFEVKGGRVEGYNPAAKRAEIEGLLHSWGVNTDLFAPELDEALYGTLGKEDLAAWREDTRFSDEGRRAAKARGDKGVGVLVSRQGMDEATRRNLLSTLGSLQGGDRISVRVGERVTFDSGKLPVDPTGTLGVKARLAGAGVAAFEVEARADGYTLTLKGGFEGKVGADVVVGQGVGPVVKLEASAGAEATYASLAGATLRFPATADGREKLVALVQRMTEGKTLDAAAWAEAQAVFGAAESGGRGQLNVAGTARAEYTGLAGQGVGASATIAGSVSYASKTSEFANLNERVSEDETEVTGAVGANVAAYAKIHNAVNTGTGYASQADGFQQAANGQYGTAGGKPLYDVSGFTGSQDIAGVGVGASVSYIKRDRQVTDADGYLTKREITKLTNVKVSPLSTVSTIGNDDLRAAAEANPEFRRDLSVLLGHMRANDLVVVGYSLDEGKMRQANTLLDQARAIRRDGGSGAAGRADALVAQARSIAADEANYRPTKVSLVPTQATKEEIGNINARFVRWDSFSDGKFAHPAIVLEVPPSG